MGFVAGVLGILLLLLILRLWSSERQLEEWAKQLTETDEQNQVVLCEEVRP